MAKLSVNQALLKANSCLKKGQISEAEEVFKTILASFPKNKRAQIGLSNLLRQNENLTKSTMAPTSKLQPLISNYKAGKHSEAVVSAQNLIVEYPNDARIWNIVGATNLAMGNIDKSQTAFEKVLELNPKSPDGHNNLGITFKEQKDFDAAINSYRKAIELKNDYAEAYNNLGNALREKKSFRSAKEAVSTAIKLKDKFSDGYVTLAKIHQDEGDIQDAISNYKKAIFLNPKAFEAYNNLGIIFKNQGHLKEALGVFEKAISINPHYAPTLLYFGNILQDQGSLEEAQKYYERAIDLNPNYIDAYRNLSLIGTLLDKPKYIENIKRLKEKNILTNEELSQVNFIEAKCYEELEKYNLAFSSYVSGAKIKKKLLRYNIECDEKIFSIVKNKSGLIDQHREIINEGHDDLNPIFIVGMPRSGTTLVEQILTSHSDISGAGELETLGKISAEIHLKELEIQYENIQKSKKYYLDTLYQYSEGKSFVTDKMPNNFLNIGFIKNALGHSKVIHVKRNKMATCWSIFKQYFSNNTNPFSYELRDVIRYYKLYEDLMQFWHEKYSGFIYDLDYDELTKNVEFETKKLIDFIGIDWQVDCINPQNNLRSVRTASQQQVRKPIYRGSSLEWLKYKPFIDEYLEDNKLIQKFK